MLLSSGRIRTRKKSSSGKGLNIYIVENVETSKKKKNTICIRLKIEKKKIILYDGVQGNVEIDTNTIEDFIILRSDNSPTYNLSASVDDKIMNISHVIRGDDHKINAIKQIILFKYGMENSKIFSYTTYSFI